ncbi:unnamed protein product [Auanema sp. JU1783]|nr:unnamed protein product [Auanema sp. JU1783]
MNFEQLIDELNVALNVKEIALPQVNSLLESYKSIGDWQRYAHFDKNGYTRNLVSTGNGAYNIIILCWGPGMASNIHDHSSADCFVKVLHGQLAETQFSFPSADNDKPLTALGQSIYERDEVSYMNDDLGLHRMENPSHSEAAVSLHIYTPPYEYCNIYDERTGRKTRSYMKFHSKFGKVVESLAAAAAPSPSTPTIVNN